MDLHDPNGNVFFEDEPWYSEYMSLETQQAAVLEEIEVYEDAQVENVRSFDRHPSVVGDKPAAAGTFAWDKWEQWAKADGVGAELAALGRSVIREAYQHNWPDELKAEAGWSDDGADMIRMALEQPDRARIRWQYLLESDGDFYWAD